MASYNCGRPGKTSQCMGSTLRGPKKQMQIRKRPTNGSGLKAETEGLIIAAQDQSLATRSYHHRIIKDGTDPQCRICGRYEETIDHIISGCPKLAKTEYIHRHNKTAAYLHWKICREYNIKTADKWYEHQPNTVTENDEITILWDMPLQTDREISANRPDIIIKHKTKKDISL